MADFYRGVLIDVMEAYDLINSIVRENAEEFYEALSWAGLQSYSDNDEIYQNYDSWQSFVDQVNIDEANIPESERTYNRYETIIQQEYSNNSVNCN